MSDLDDPRVLFAGERTLMAWNRTCLTMMALGFGVERFGLFLKLIPGAAAHETTSRFSFVVGISMIFFAAILQILAMRQFTVVLASLRPVEIPSKYNVHLVLISSGFMALLSLLIGGFLLFGGR